MFIETENIYGHIALATQEGHFRAPAILEFIYYPRGQLPMSKKNVSAGPERTRTEVPSIRYGQTFNYAPDKPNLKI